MDNFRRSRDTVRGLVAAETNTTASEGRIRHADIAKEAVYYAKLRLLNQSGFFTMSQANEQNWNILSLLS